MRACWVRTAALFTSSLLLAAPAAAEPVSLSALCPKASGDDIVVCGDSEPRSSPYRLPIPLPPEVGTDASVSVSRERNALFDYDAGGSVLCSSVGPGGVYGCAFKQLKRGVEQRAGGMGSDPRGRIYEGTPD